MMRRARSVCGLVVLAATLVVSGATTSAHPTATTSFTLTVSPDHTFEVSIATDADGLLAKLSALAGETLPAAPLSRAIRDARLTALQTTLVDRLDVRIDDTRMPLAFAGIDDLEGQLLIVRLTGHLPREGQTVTFQSSFVYGSYPLIVRHLGAERESLEWLEGPQASQAHSLTSPSSVRSTSRVVVRDFMLGFTHILPNGLDHILFVLGLFLLSTRLRSMLAQVSAFTIAHSITLGLTLYGVVSIPASVIEPLIAVSIVYVACENLWTSDLTAWRLAIVFGFGLLHGMGFAQALARLGLARSEFLTTLVTFNIGVEAGQLSVIGLAAVAVWACAVPRAHYRRLVIRPASMGIAAIGAFWVIERLL
jgi:hypothetical protein